jgi:hypothetical protein
MAPMMTTAKTTAKSSMTRNAHRLFLTLSGCRLCIIEVRPAPFEKRGIFHYATMYPAYFMLSLLFHYNEQSKKTQRIF